MITPADIRFDEANDGWLRVVSPLPMTIWVRPGSLPNGRLVVKALWVRSDIVDVAAMRSVPVAVIETALNP